MVTKIIGHKFQPRLGQFINQSGPLTAGERRTKQRTVNLVSKVSNCLLQIFTLYNLCPHRFGSSDKPFFNFCRFCHNFSKLV